MIIKTSRQLKDKISNLSGNDSTKAQMLIRKYMMERFLARIAQSEYKNNFILKGGIFFYFYFTNERETKNASLKNLRFFDINYKLKI